MSDPGDLIGLPHKNVETGHTEFMPPFWWPTENKPVVLFLDELNRARPELLQAIQDLTLNRTLAGRKLPEDSRIVSAVNAGDEYQITDLDPALVSRFNIYEFVPEIEDWIAWAHRAKLDERVITFIQKNSNYLDPPQRSETDDEHIEKTPDRRAWVRVSDIVLNLKDITPQHIKAIAGIVGVNAAMSFRKFIDTLQTVTPDQVVLHFTKKLVTQLNKLSLQDLVHLNQQVLLWTNEHLKDFKKGQRTKALQNLEKYVHYLKDSDHREVLADFFNTLQTGDLDNVRSFFVESKEIYNLLIKFADGIKL
ncbi:MAG: alkaline phosphatase D [Candidatus Magnetoglobus multicellularis str. Araruama]|uniref:Alkaline phosphatase D n=1 Tax=Candidatus Magnetoglobus multicellularis str. Araruama TaxID=890399 RepID=A0A1V1PEJ1_9BACT|nr:MAG: alkaline phosphatase D [Candidatus Magnetoglobus multicellularis str. Araruama]